MKNYEEIIGEAVRVEFSEKTGEIFLVFNITNEEFKNTIKKDWTQDIELKIIDKKIYLKE